ncbi:MAG: TonB-dependent receptor [Gemmatimonadaceae bacterium]
MPVVLLAVASLTTVAPAQTPAASRTAPQGRNLIGIVRDTAGKPIGNVQVVVSSLHRVALTDDRGEFFLRALPAGTYHLDMVRIGFAAEHRVVTVPATGEDVRLTVTMRVATVRLASVNVTAAPSGADPLDVTQATVQLSGKELQRTVSSSLGQTLSSEPGMAARFNGPLASTPVIRGLTGERVLVLQDGDRTGDLSSASADHMNAVDPSAAERIEVIRGPASLLYGNNALGGVVNVISSDIPTTIPSRVSGSVSGQGESVTPGGTMSASLTVPVGTTVALTARGGFRNFQDMRVGGGLIQANTGGRTDNLTLGAGYVGKQGTVGVVYRQMGFNYGLPHPAEDDGIRIEGDRKMVALQSTWDVGQGLLHSVKLDATAQQYSHNEVESDGAIGTTFSLSTHTANITAKTQMGALTGSVGVQGLFRGYTPSGDEAFTPGAQNNNVAAFVYQELPLTRGPADGHAPSLQFGARFDHFTLTTRPGDAVDRFGPATSVAFNNLASSLGLSLPVASDVSLTANVSHGFRAPTVEELFANGFHAAVGTFDLGNPNIRPEQSTGFEAGLRAQTPHTFAQLSTYYNLIDGYIRPVAEGIRKVDGAPVPLVRYRQNDAVMYGVEGQVETKLPRHFVGGLMGDLTRAELRGLSLPLPYIPAGRLGGSIRYDDGGTAVGVEVRRVFAQSRVSGDALDIATDPYTLFNLSASRIITRAGRYVHAITLRADNLLDAQYRDATSRIKSYAFNPGRNLSVVYKLMF